MHTQDRQDFECMVGCLIENGVKCEELVAIVRYEYDRYIETFKKDTTDAK